MAVLDEDHQRTPIPLCQRRLASELRRLRETTGLTRKQVSEHLFCHISKVSRIETGKFTPNLRDVRDLLELYRVQGRVHDDLLRAYLDQPEEVEEYKAKYSSADCGCRLRGHSGT